MKNNIIKIVKWKILIEILISYKKIKKEYENPMIYMINLLFNKSYKIIKKNIKTEYNNKLTKEK